MKLLSAIVKLGSCLRGNPLWTDAHSWSRSLPPRTVPLKALRIVTHAAHIHMVVPLGFLLRGKENGRDYDYTAYCKVAGETRINEP